METISRTTRVLRQMCRFIAVILLMVSLFVIIYSIKHERQIKYYKQHSNKKEVNIIECIKEKDFLLFGNSYKIKISFFTKPILEGGEFKLYTITKFVNKKLYDELKSKKKAVVLFPNHTMDEQTMIFKYSLLKDYYASYNRIDYGIALFFASIVLLIIVKYSKYKTTQKSKL